MMSWTGYNIKKPRRQGLSKHKHDIQNGQGPPKLDTTNVSSPPSLNSLLLTNQEKQQQGTESDD